MDATAAVDVVLCPGHGVFVGRGDDADPAKDSNWLIAPFQVWAEPKLFFFVCFFSNVLVVSSSRRFVLYT